MTSSPHSLTVVRGFLYSRGRNPRKQKHSVERFPFILALGQTSRGFKPSCGVSCMGLKTVPWTGPRYRLNSLSKRKATWAVASD